MPLSEPLDCYSQRRKQRPQRPGQKAASAIPDHAARSDISSWADTSKLPSRRERSWLSVASAQELSNNPSQCRICDSRSSRLTFSLRFTEQQTTKQEPTP